ncbi:MAG: hypothetical protein R2852_06210 [Bacteroidia bacterium]
MTSELNKQYFKTKQEHKKNVSKDAWFIWIAIFLIFSISVILGVRTDIQKQEDAPRKDSTVLQP